METLNSTSECFRLSKNAQIPRMLQHKAGGMGRDGLPSDALNVGVSFLGMMAHCNHNENG
eukprot:7084376-Ditylum_brightwellii.AAC.1